MSYHRWLTSSPHCAGLKSVLRHKLADMSDLEENDDDSVDVTAVARVSQELSDVRRQLHDAFALDDQLLVSEYWVE